MDPSNFGPLRIHPEFLPKTTLKASAIFAVTQQFPLRVGKIYSDILEPAVNHYRRGPLRFTALDCVHNTPHWRSTNGGITLPTTVQPALKLHSRSAKPVVNELAYRRVKLDKLLNRSDSSHQPSAKKQADLV